MVTKRVSLQDQEEAVKLFGPHDKNLKELERRFGVQIFVRPSGMDSLSGIALAVRGRPRQVDQALSTLEEMKRQASRPKQNGHAEEAVEVPPQGVPATRGAGHDTVYVTITGRPIRPQTEVQAQYVEAIRKFDMVFGVGPAGTGKTYLAVACAVAALETGRSSRIVLTRPIVEAGEKLGFLPGDFYEKVHPYLKPLYDAFYSMVGPDKFRQLRDDEVIEIIPLAYMRGRTLDNAFVILDEAQNTTPEQMKMFLTRLGQGSRMVVTGDPTQIDLENKTHTGLLQAEEVLKGVEGVSFVRFGEADVVRHGLVRSVIRAYQAWEDRPGFSMNFVDRAFLAPVRRALLKLLAFTEPHGTAPSTRRESFFSRDVRVPTRLVGATLWVMLVVVLYQELGPGWPKALAVAVLTGLVAVLFVFYLRRNHPELLEDEEAVSLLGVILIVSVWSMELWAESARMSPRMSTLGLPLAAAPILVSILLSARLAVIVAVALSVLYGVIVGFSFDETAVKLLGGVTGVAASLHIRARRDIARAGFWVALAQALTVLSVGFLRDWPVHRILVSAGWVGASGLAAALVVGAVLPYLENFFSRLTPMRLLELGDVNHPLLRRMSLEAPGTYHHSLIMASLASAAAEAVGANALLCRAGAYFHDIGKMVKPEYFVENQGALGNPHDPLPPNMSRLVIQSHVKEGLALARQHGLDKAVADFIGTHHGTSRIEYFYRRALERTEDLDEVGEDDYRYPGPKPHSRETAILMLADSVEASVRTLREPTPQRIRDQIKKIIEQKTADGQFDNVPLTFQDIFRISESFFNTLTGVYHNRIRYPGQEAEPGAEPAA